MTVQRDFDLEKQQYRIEPATRDLVLIAYYLQRDLLEPAKSGVRLGGVMLVIVHIADGHTHTMADNIEP